MEYIYQMIKLLLKILGEKKVFNEDEYNKIEESLLGTKSPMDTIAALEQILINLKNK